VDVSIADSSVAGDADPPTTTVSATVVSIFSTVSVDR
jgi:hypothetical protein